MMVGNESKVEFLTLTAGDISGVDDLMKKDRRTLGFLPTEALTDYLGRGRVISARTENDGLIGYLLYAPGQSRLRIVHLCVSAEFRGNGIASRLLEELKSTATTQSAITLSCRRGFPAHHLDLGLFQAQTSDETFDVIIDAQVFFDPFKPDSEESEPSKALLADFLVDSLNLRTTDELFNEIDRNEDAGVRQAGRVRMQRSRQPLFSNWPIARVVRRTLSCYHNWRLDASR